MPLAEDGLTQVSATSPVVLFGFGPLELSLLLFPVSLGGFPTASPVMFLLLLLSDIVICLGAIPWPRHYSQGQDDE